MVGLRARGSRHGRHPCQRQLPRPQYQRLKPRRGHKRALGAVKHTILTAIWHMLSTGELYRDLGGDFFTRRDPQRQTRRLIAQLERLGHTVTLTEGAAVT